MIAPQPTPWWRGAVVYQVYPRSFADSNGDGVGELPGIRSRLAYLEWLGVDALWLNPIYPSENRDWGYDVVDHCAVNPELGTLDDLDALVADARARGIRVLLDLVPGHTSDRHAWFGDRGRRDTWYIWADEPTEEESTFGGPAWTRDVASGRWYHHLFLAEQPDLNWLNAEVREAFDEILRFWFARGIAGFRVDVAHEFVKDERGRADRDRVHEVLRRFRDVADESAALLIGETWLDDLEELMRFYGADDELHLPLNFPFLFAGLGGMRGVVERTEELLPPFAWPVWALSNHDVVRFPTRIADADDARTCAALLILLTLRGTPILYYGDELGMRQAAIPPERVLDVDGRDGARTPMRWDRTAWPTSWLPLGDDRAIVDDQRRDPGSVLSFCRDVLALRRRFPQLRDGDYAPLDAPDGIWAWRRGDGVTVAVNLGRERAQIDLPGRIALATPGGTPPVLEPWQGVVLA